ncbi:2,2-dialkylglycine decarboxylase [Setomelanomma holmii]|uniref:2,2-dialkylglycine decarboxylase n=1 Tax=Setomelanomma holmii TaxID=210430 RepID=A0A9P4HGI4_9PLEO|nr:2,2-dialkylglycine decarboxylase [Setomelanomma holmii]
MSGAYDNVNAEQLQHGADSCLLTYGTAFHPEIITRTYGIHVETASGHRLMDFTTVRSNVALIGHGHPEVVEVIHEHAKHLDHLFSGMISPPVISLAKRLTGAAPAGLDKAFFLSTGGESNEAAIRLAKFFTGKFEIVGLASSWHGITGASLGAQYHAGRSGYGPNMIGNLALPTSNAYRSIFRHSDGSYDWKTELDYGVDLLDKQSCGSLAAVILEPILSSGGMLELPPGYLKALKKHRDARGMLMIVDEAQTALGRAGDMFAFTHHPDDEGVDPDIVTLSKTLGNGLPISAVLTSNQIAQYAKETGFLFYTTHNNDPLPAAVGDKVLEIVIRDDLCARSKRLGVKLQAGLRRLQSRYGCIGDVRGRGLMAGCEIVSDRNTKAGAPDVGRAVSDKMVEMGLWAQLATMTSFGGVFRIAPPITVTEEQLDLVLAIMEEALRTTPGTTPLYEDNVVSSTKDTTIEARL